MTQRADALVIGAGPAGAATSILLARAGWQVILVEQDRYPRRKVCGECIPAGTLALLDELGIGAGVRTHAGPELRHIGWMSQSATLIADFPECTDGPYRYGRALSRQYLDTLLVERAIALGVVVFQPARVRAIHGEPGEFQCEIDSASTQRQTLSATTVVDAHGSWQRGPGLPPTGRTESRRQQRPSDLFAFKAEFQHTMLDPGLLPVIALPGGYGGMVVAGLGRATLACCLRRDLLSAWRAKQRGLPVGEAVENYLRQECVGIRESLAGAQRVGPWLTVGPLRPGMHHHAAGGVFSVGNAAGETHPLIGEGIGMALQSARLLAHELTQVSPTAITAQGNGEIQRRYARAWRQAFSQRLQVASLYAHIAMRPQLASSARRLLRRWPALLTSAARLAGKARSPSRQSSTGIQYEHT